MSAAGGFLLDAGRCRCKTVVLVDEDSLFCRVV